MDVKQCGLFYLAAHRLIVPQLAIQIQAAFQLITRPTGPHFRITRPQIKANIAYLLLNKF